MKALPIRDGDGLHIEGTLRPADFGLLLELPSPPPATKEQATATERHEWRYEVHSGQLDPDVEGHRARPTQ